MSGKATAEAPADEPDARPRPRYRRPADDLIREAARSVLRGSGRSFGSQEGLRKAVLPVLRRDDRLYSVGGRRLRRLLLRTRGVKVVVRYREVPTARPLESCPVCEGKLLPIRNATLQGGRVTLGYRCSRCEYWTHLKRRVPVRYAFVVGSRSARTLRGGEN